MSKRELSDKISVTLASRSLDRRFAPKTGNPSGSTNV
jgi:hypothetical protein